MMPRMSDRIYHEQFDNGRGGWYGWISNAGGPKPLEWLPGEVTSRSPWWIDYNHAPPGAGYMHMVFCLATAGPQGEVFMEARVFSLAAQDSQSVSVTTRPQLTPKLFRLRTPPKCPIGPSTRNGSRSKVSNRLLRVACGS